MHIVFNYKMWVPTLFLLCFTAVAYGNPYGYYETDFGPYDYADTVNSYGPTYYPGEDFWTQLWNDYYNWNLFRYLTRSRRQTATVTTGSSSSVTGSGTATTSTQGQANTGTGQVQVAGQTGLQGTGTTATSGVGVLTNRPGGGQAVVGVGAAATTQGGNAFTQTAGQATINRPWWPGWPQGNVQVSGLTGIQGTGNTQQFGQGSLDLPGGSGNVQTGATAQVLAGQAQTQTAGQLNISGWPWYYKEQPTPTPPPASLPPRPTPEK